MNTLVIDLRRVDAYLARWRWERMVDGTGKITLNNHSSLMRRAYAGQVHFDLADRRCHCRLVSGLAIGPPQSGEWLARRGRPYAGACSWPIVITTLPLARRVPRYRSASAASPNG